MNDQRVMKHTPNTGTAIHLPFPAKVTRQWRDGLLSAYPALGSHPRRRTYLRMVEYILFSTMREEESGRLVVPAAALALLDGAYDSQRRADGSVWSALELLNAFSGDVWPLQIEAHVPGVTARTIDPTLPDDVLALPDSGRAYHVDEADRWVWLVSGVPVSPTSRRKCADRYSERLTYLTEVVDRDHPAACLLAYLNGQPPHTLMKVVRTNWPTVTRLLDGMPDDTPSARLRRASAAYTVGVLADRVQMLYAPSATSARIHTSGVTLHQLPRALRKAALAGGVEMDIRSSQLAIVAKLWDLPTVTEFLRKGLSIWEELAGALGMEVDMAKPTLKEAVYATAYGMGRARIRSLVATGSRINPGLGEAAADAYMAHYLIVEVLAGRSRAMQAISETGGIVDAFNRHYEAKAWWRVHAERRGASWGDDTPPDPDCPPVRQYAHHALLSIQAQSHELALMLPVFELLRVTPHTSILSWLHDGLVVYPHDRREDRVKSLEVRASEVFNRNAADLGYATELEVTRLT
jgi:hypothetical protein